MSRHRFTVRYERASLSSFCGLNAIHTPRQHCQLVDGCPLVRRFSFPLLLLAARRCRACGGYEEPTPAPTQPSTPPPQGPATLQVMDLTTGEGTEATGTRAVLVHYTLWLYRPGGARSKGTRIESSRDAGRQPYPFRLGTNAVIAGFEQGVTGMKVGGNRRADRPALARLRRDCQRQHPGQLLARLRSRAPRGGGLTPPSFLGRR